MLAPAHGASISIILDHASPKMITEWLG